MARTNNRGPRINAVAESNATCRSMRLLEEMDHREAEVEIPSSRTEDEYTETPRPSSKSSSRPLVSSYTVAWVPCWCGIESTACQTHRRPTLRFTRRFRGYGWWTSLGPHSLLLQNLQSGMQPPDACRQLFINHQGRRCRKHPRNPHRSPPVHCRRRMILCQRQHLVLWVPSKPTILAKGPWCPWPSIQAVRVSSTKVLRLILFPKVGKPKRLTEDRSREESTSSMIHRLEKFRNKLP